MNLNMKKIAPAAALGGLVAVLGIGYGTSIAMFDDTVQAAKVGIANYLNSSLKLPNDTQIGVEILDKQGSGLSRDLLLVIVGGEDKIVVPIEASIGFMNYDFDFALDKATGNGESLLKLADLTKVTSLTSTATLNLCTSKFSGEIEAQYLNNFALTAAAVASSEVENLKKSLGYKDLGTASIRFVIDDQENIHTSVKVDSFASSGISFSAFNYVADTQGFLDFKNLGKHALSLNNLAFVTYEGIEKVDKITLRSDASNVSNIGSFDAVSNIFISNLGNKYTNLNIDTKITNLNIKDINELIKVAEENNYGIGPYNLIDFAMKHAIDLTVLPSSSITYKGTVQDEKWQKPREQDIQFTLSGKLSSDGKIVAQSEAQAEQSQEGYIAATLNSVANYDLSKLVDKSPLLDRFFVAQDGKYQSTVELSVSPINPKLHYIKVNGNPISN